MAKVTHKPKKDKPAKSEKTKTRQRLVAKGVDLAVAKHVSGVDDDTLDREQIAARRIEWQRGLPKA